MGTVVVIIAASMAGFSIVRLRPKFNFFLFLVIYSGTLFPFQMYLIPVYRLFNTLGLYDTRMGMILIYSAICIPFSLFVYRGFYTTIPREIEEAAKLDGCGPVRSFFVGVPSRSPCRPRRWSRCSRPPGSGTTCCSAWCSPAQSRCGPSWWRWPR